MTSKHVRSPEDREPREQVEPQQEKVAVRYDLIVRLAPPYSKRTLVIRQYEDGREKDLTLSIKGPSLVA